MIASRRTRSTGHPSRSFENPFTVRWLANFLLSIAVGLVAYLRAEYRIRVEGYYPPRRTP